MSSVYDVFIFEENFMLRNVYYINRLMICVDCWDVCLFFVFCFLIFFCFYVCVSKVFD